MVGRSLLYLGFAAFSILGQNQTTTVDGHVMNSLTGEAIGGAIVRLIPLRSMAINRERRNQQTTSLADGTFHLDGVNPGTYFIRAEHSGFSLARGARSKFVDLSSGQSVADQTILLAPDSTLSGTVLDDAGSPVAGAHIVAIAHRTTGGRTLIEERSSSDAEPSGNFTLKGLRPGNYFIEAEPPTETSAEPSQHRKDQNATGELVRTLFPRALELEEATAIRVTAGQSQSDLKLYLRRATTHQVRGKVAELPADRGLRITMIPRGTGTSNLLGFEGTVAKDGTFAINGVLPGAYTLQLYSRRAYPIARQNIDVGAEDVSGLVLTLLAPVTLSGTVTVDGNTGRTMPRVRIFIKHADDPKNSAVNVNPDGSLVISNLDPVPTIFHAVVATPGFYVKSILLNQQEVKHRPVDLSDMGHGRLDIILRGATGEIDGRVPDAVNGTTTGIIAVPHQLAPDASNIVQKYANNDGTFMIPNLEPGEYHLYAVATMQSALWQTAEFLQAIQNFGTAVQLDENQHQQVQLSEIPQETIEQTADQLGLTVE